MKGQGSWGESQAQWTTDGLQWVLAVGTWPWLHGSRNRGDLQSPQFWVTMRHQNSGSQKTTLLAQVMNIPKRKLRKQYHYNTIKKGKILRNKCNQRPVYQKLQSTVERNERPLCSWIGRLTVVKVAVPPSYSTDAMPSPSKFQLPFLQKWKSWS